MPRHLKRIALGAGLGLLAYLALWPVPVAPRTWDAPAPPGYVGVHAPNERLAGLRMIDLGGEEGPEHVALGPDGHLYAAVASGKILRMNAEGSDRQVFADTHGRVLGFAFDAAGDMLAADALAGLLRITPDGKAQVLVDRVGDAPILFADAVVIAPDGQVYFTDASTRFGAAAWGGTFEASVLDIIEQSATGRVLAYDPATRTTRVVARGLSFANGIALSTDARRLFVVETGRYRVWSLPIDAADLNFRAGTRPTPGSCSTTCRGTRTT